MASVQFFLPYKFPGLNDYIEQERIHRMAGAAMKKKWTDIVIKETQSHRFEPITRPVGITFEWFEQNLRRDPDNIIFAKKFILDGIVKAGLIKNDTQKNIVTFNEEWSVRPTKIGVMVTIDEYA